MASMLSRMGEEIFVADEKFLDMVCISFLNLFFIFGSPCFYILWSTFFSFSLFSLQNKIKCFVSFQFQMFCTIGHVYIWVGSCVRIFGDGVNG